MFTSTLLSTTVIIPTQNRVAELRSCLEALAAAQPQVLECIIVDDASAVDIAHTLKDLPFETVFVRLQNPSGSAVARNVGAGAARGEILLFIDDDVCVQPGSVEGVIAAMSDDPSLGAVFGRYDDSPSDPHFFSQFRNLLHAYTHRISAGTASTFWTGFGAVRTSIFRDHGGFLEQPHSIDDVEFGTRLSRAGVHVELRADLQVKHLKRWTLKSMLYTDLFLRGMPWTLLVWRQRSVPNTLNLRLRSRLSVGLAVLAALLAVASVTGPVFWALSLVCVVAVLVLNVKFYVFLRGRRGSRFAFAGVGAHWIYLWTAGLSFAMGTALFLCRAMHELLSGRKRQHSSINGISKEPQAETVSEPVT